MGLMSANESGHWRFFETRKHVSAQDELSGVAQLVIQRTLRARA